MKTSLKIISLMTAAMSFLSVMGNKGRPVNIDCYNKPMNQTAFLGGSFVISCNYTSIQESGIKSFCREGANSHCNNLISAYDSNYTRLDRFSLKDDKQQRVYTVSISTLTQQDAGEYQCTIKSGTSTVCLTKIHLHILNWNDIKPNEIGGVTSETAGITCNYSKSEEDNEKFLCKGENPLNCEELIWTTEEDRDVVKGRFHIRDHKRRNYIYVYINDLRRTDSGTYWCGSGKTMENAEYTKIHLSVTERHNRTKKSVTRSLQGTAEPQQKNVRDDPEDDKKQQENLDIVIGVGVGVGSLVVIAIIVIILYKRKLLKISECCAAEGSSEQRTNAGHNTEGNTGDHHYEEINVQKWQESSLQSVCANVSPPADMVHYATVDYQKYENIFPVTSENGSAPMGQDATSPSADMVHYATVDFHNDGNTLPDTNKNSSAAMGQSAANPPAAETTLYSTVIKQGEQ